VGVDKYITTCQSLRKISYKICVLSFITLLEATERFDQDIG
jgi:hypothetical protein